MCVSSIQQCAATKNSKTRDDHPKTLLFRSKQTGRMSRMRIGWLLGPYGLLPGSGSHRRSALVLPVRVVWCFLTCSMQFLLFFLPKYETMANMKTIAAQSCARICFPPPDDQDGVAMNACRLQAWPLNVEETELVAKCILQHLALSNDSLLTWDPKLVLWQVLKMSPGRWIRELQIRFKSQTAATYGNDHAVNHFNQWLMKLHEVTHLSWGLCHISTEGCLAQWLNHDV